MRRRLRVQSHLEESQGSIPLGGGSVQLRAVCRKSAKTGCPCTWYHPISLYWLYWPSKQTSTDI